MAAGQALVRRVLADLDRLCAECADYTVHFRPGRPPRFAATVYRTLDEGSAAEAAKGLDTAPEAR